MYIPGNIMLLFVRTNLDAVVLNDDSYNIFKPLHDSKKTRSPAF